MPFIRSSLEWIDWETECGFVHLPNGERVHIDYGDRVLVEHVIQDNGEPVCVIHAIEKPTRH